MNLVRCGEFGLVKLTVSRFLKDLKWRRSSIDDDRFTARSSSCNGEDYSTSFSLCVFSTLHVIDTFEVVFWNSFVIKWNTTFRTRRSYEIWLIRFQWWSRACYALLREKEFTSVISRANASNLHALYNSTRVCKYENPFSRSGIDIFPDFRRKISKTFSLENSAAVTAPCTMHWKS